MTLQNADNLYQKGKFDEAGKIYAEIIEKNSMDIQSLTQLGKIALLSNCFDKAEDYLKKAIEIKPEDEKLNMLLVEVYYRQDRFQEIVPILERIGKLDIAKKYESFKSTIPLHIESDKKATTLKFLKTDPLPIIQLSINDCEPVNFFIDTGAAETILDVDFAKELGVEIYYTKTGVFAGGKNAPIQLGKINSMIIGDFRISNIPVSILPVRHFSDLVFGGTKVDGIIGTTLFYHFLTTMDYVNGELILQRKTENHLQELERKIESQNSIVVPFWLAGDHFIVSWGKVNKSKSLLFFVDTGLAGGGFTCTESTLKEGNIKLDMEKASTGIGGGGSVQAVPFVVESLSLGDAKEENIRGIFTKGSKLENLLDFQLGGIISHGFFRNYSVTFDFTKMRLILNRMIVD